MKHLIISKINPKVVEQLENAHSRVRFEEPNFTHHDQLKDYAESLTVVDEAIKESKIIQWVTPILEQTLNLWRSRYTQNSDLIRDAQKEKIELENARKYNSHHIGEIETKLSDLNEEITKEENNIHDRNMDEIESENIDLGSEKLKVSLLLLFSILIAIGTYIYFAKAQNTVYWTTMPAAAKVAEVDKLIRGGSTLHYAAFKDDLEPLDKPFEVLSSDERDQLTIDIDKSIIDQSPEPTLLQYFASDLSRVFLAAGAFMLILLGKLTSIVYERLGSPNWMYYLIFIFAMLVLIGAILSMASITSKKLSIDIINDEIIEIKTDIKEIEDESGSIFGGIVTEDEEKSEKQLKLEEKLNNLTTESSTIQKTFNGINSISMILFMLTEILIGSLAWIGYSEYITKRMRVRKGISGYIKIYQKNIDRIKSNINMLLVERKELEEANHLATDLIHRLNAMLSDIISREDLNRLAQNYIDRELSFAQAILQKAQSSSL